MPQIQITNCHIHTFTHRHIPVDYPSRLLRIFKHVPGLIRGLAWLARFGGQHGIADKLDRLFRFNQQSAVESQGEILDEVLIHYPSNTRFVVLPMDMAGMGYGPVADDLPTQHNELAKLARTIGDGRIIPFATLVPANDLRAEETWRAIDELGFRGLKIYPRLGFAPDDPVLMTCVYPEFENRGLPVMAHCSRGGVQRRDVADHTANRCCDPAAYEPVMQEFPNLKICLAHFGGQLDWDDYVNHGGGGGDAWARKKNWQVAIRDMISCGMWSGLWTDISYTLFRTDDYLPFLRLFLTADDDGGERLRRRVLFGSDYYMTRQEELSERAVCFRLRNALGEEIFRQIAEVNPRVWLGEEDETRDLWKHPA